MSTFHFNPYCLYAGVALLSRPHTMLLLHTNAHLTEITNQTPYAVFPKVYNYLTSSAMETSVDTTAPDTARYFVSSFVHSRGALTQVQG